MAEEENTGPDFSVMQPMELVRYWNDYEDARTAMDGMLEGLGSSSVDDVAAYNALLEEFKKVYGTNAQKRSSGVNQFMGMLSKTRGKVMSAARRGLKPSFTLPPKVSREALASERATGKIGTYTAKMHYNTGTEKGIAHYGRSAGTANAAQLQNRFTSGFSGHGVYRSASGREAQRRRYLSGEMDGHGGYYGRLLGSKLGRLAPFLTPVLDKGEDWLVDKAATALTKYKDSNAQMTGSGRYDEMTLGRSRGPLMEEYHNQQVDAQNRAAAEAMLAQLQGHGDYTQGDDVQLAPGGMFYDPTQEKYHVPDHDMHRPRHGGGMADADRDGVPDIFQAGKRLRSEFGNDHRVHQNQLVNPGLSDHKAFTAFTVGDETGDFVMKGSQWVGAVRSTSTAFQTVQIIDLNPGLPVFSDISRIAACFGEFAFLKCIVQFRSKAIAGNDNVAGTVIVSPQTNPDKPAYTTRQQVEGNAHHVSSRVTDSIIAGIECDPAKLSGNHTRYVRTGPLGRAALRHNYDWGFVQICTDGVPPDVNIGDVYVSYEVRFSKFEAGGTGRDVLAIGEGASASFATNVPRWGVRWAHDWISGTTFDYGDAPVTFPLPNWTGTTKSMTLAAPIPIAHSLELIGNGGSSIDGTGRIIGGADGGEVPIITSYNKSSNLEMRIRAGDLHPRPAQDAGTGLNAADVGQNAGRNGILSLSFAAAAGAVYNFVVCMHYSTGNVSQYDENFLLGTLELAGSNGTAPAGVQRTRSGRFQGRVTQGRLQFNDLTSVQIQDLAPVSRAPNGPVSAGPVGRPANECAFIEQCAFQLRNPDTESAEVAVEFESFADLFPYQRRAHTLSWSFIRVL